MTTISPVTENTAPDEERFAELVREQRAALLSYVNRLTGGDRGWAEDVLQETFLRAWHNIHRLVPERGSVHGWLRRVAHNLVVDGYRTRQARPLEQELTSDESDTALLPDHADTVLARMVVSTMLGRVRNPHRSTLVQLYLRDQTTAEAAAALGVPVGTVKSRAHHALRTLRQEAGHLGLRDA
ncbi:sigma-70 family RNA polymerase sigma factor [Frankia sp. Cpl3]|nr:sigma-70 family RNA polymerase sigma factor [Frankia sp. Cpl3]